MALNGKRKCLVKKKSIIKIDPNQSFCTSAARA
jgi:hypothetical protein